ncbi:MAG: protein-tyrosine-phosphatase, partial [Bacteroidota bacterium]
MLFPAVRSTCERLSAQFDSIPAERKTVLHQMATYIQQSMVRSDHKTASVIVICTHNSRRSHMGQLWLQIASDFYEVQGLETFSGGTEATAFNPNAVQAMRSLGLQIVVDQPGDNPIYACRWTEEGPAYHAFSTRFDEAPNPSAGFLA